MLAKIATVFSLAFGVLWLGDRLSNVQWLGAVVAIVGSVVVAFEPGGAILRAGSLLILGSTLLYALHTAIVKRYGGQIDFTNFFFFRIFATTAMLFVIAAGRRVLVWPQPDAWAIITLTAVVDIIISRVLYYAALRRLTMSIHTIVLTLGPVATILWSRILFGTLPGRQEMIGGITVLIGVMLVTWPRKQSADEA
jgi:drug/metabolite transporter (DMT)-like permease